MSWYYELKTHHRLSEQTRSLVAPLIDSFDTDHVSYFFVDSTGNSSCLCSSPEWMELYFDRQLYLDNPFLKHPDLVPEGAFWSQRGSSLVLISKSEDKIRGFSLGHARDANQLMPEVPLLKRAFSWFEQEAWWAIERLAIVNVLPLVDNQFFQPSILPMESQKRKNLFKLLGIHDPQLSKREKACLHLCIEGESARTIGETLGLSPRTVESYLGSAKEKLNVFSKAQLIKQGLLLRDLGLLP